MTFEDIRNAAALIGACESSGKVINASANTTFNFNKENATIDKTSAKKDTTTAWVFGSHEEVKIS